ncbi:MAG: hypothetical protein JNM10_03950 [Planctomycetia bacterium]|nr:hypothetical protein [Planctomycetia bacterium]
MTEARTLTLAPAPADAPPRRAHDGWTFLGSTPEKTAVEVVLRAFDTDIEFATGTSAAHPDAPATRVRPGEGARLSGLFFFARPASATAKGRILVRGV